MEKEYFNNDFEEWEADSNYIDKEDWKGLLELRSKRDFNKQSDLYAQQRYAEALILNKLFREAIDFLSPLYIKHHDVGFGIQEIIQGLYGLGKTEDDFPWISKPDIIKLDQNMIQRCMDFMTGKRKPTSVIDIYGHFLMNSDFMDFNEKTLGLFLHEKTNLFEIIGDKTEPYDLKFKLKRK
jgi:hypothetical protein